MHPVQHFRSNFDQPTAAYEQVSNQQLSSAHGVQEHENESHARNICLIWPDGRRAFLNYAYLVAGKFDPNLEKNLIKLIFSSYSVVLRGYDLETLFMDLLDHLPRIIAAVDTRYALPEGHRQPVVVEMVVEEQND